jgi:hypothetical protein
MLFLICSFYDIFLVFHSISFYTSCSRGKLTALHYNLAGNKKEINKEQNKEHSKQWISFWRHRFWHIIQFQRVVNLIFQQDILCLPSDKPRNQDFSYFLSEKLILDTEKYGDSSFWKVITIQKLTRVIYCADAKGQVT